MGESEARGKSTRERKRKGETSGELARNLEERVRKDDRPSMVLVDVPLTTKCVILPAISWVGYHHSHCRDEESMTLGG